MFLFVGFSETKRERRRRGQEVLTLDLWSCLAANSVVWLSFLLFSLSLHTSSPLLFPFVPSSFGSSPRDPHSSLFSPPAAAAAAAATVALWLRQWGNAVGTGTFPIRVLSGASRPLLFVIYTVVVDLKVLSGDGGGGATELAL